ncbi:hypothetical protein AGMMS49975_25480 [Clostridia bacterium]|nr:hypothetical protein AGMMS49975_25480 [Clostridia bacterium]
MNSHADYKESDMYPPVKAFFETQGYVMRGEVKTIDAAAIRDGELVLFEFKKSFNTTLLIQALKRQTISEKVYIVIPRQSSKNSKDLPYVKHISESLKLGLICVAMDSPLKTVEIICEPPCGRIKVNKNKHKSVVRELEGRNIDANNAGSTGLKLLTAYREASIKIACVMYKHGAFSAKELVAKYDCDKKTYNILYNNFYGWFTRVSKGVYFLAESGFAEIENNLFDSAVKFYLEF